VTVRRYESQGAVVLYDAARCIHAAECVRGLPAVFNPQARPWIQPESANARELAAVIHRCPTGALTLERKDGGAAEQPDATNTVAIEPNGPLYLRVRIRYAGGSHAALAEYTRVALCRCGASANKPFCDGSHRKSGFTDAGACSPRDRDTPAAPQPATGPVKLNPIANGPLMVEGWIEFKAADGSTFIAGEKCWLCRCGHSRHKPFCDSSHKAAGFIS
jgi:CDGSH-type Zn-finger protein/uncharacterized Fe-S cluster protein YjdI